MAREDGVRQLLVTDPHSMPEFRPSGAVRNMEAWYPPFDVKPTDRLFLPTDQRVKTW